LRSFPGPRARPPGEAVSLAGQEAFVAIGRQRRPSRSWALPYWADIEVVHAAVTASATMLEAAPVSSFITQSAKADDGELLAGLAQRAAGDGAVGRRGRRVDLAGGCDGRGGDGGLLENTRRSMVCLQGLQLTASLRKLLLHRMRAARRSSVNGATAPDKSRRAPGFRPPDMAMRRRKRNRSRGEPIRGTIGPRRASRY